MGARATATLFLAMLLCMFGCSALIATRAWAGIATAQPNITIPASVGTGPNGVTFNPTGTKSYITISSTDKIDVVTKSTGAVTTVILTTCSGPMGVVFTPNNLKAYVACYNSNSVVEFSPSNPVTSATTITVGTAPFFIAMSPDGSEAYVANSGGSSGTVSVINTTSDLVTATIPVGLAPVAVAFNPAGTIAYVADSGSNLVTMIDVGSSTVPAGTVALPNPITVKGVPYGLAFSGDGSSLWVSQDNKPGASVIDTATNTIGTSFTLAGKPEGVTLSPDGRRVYMPMQSGGIAVFDSASQTLLSYLASGVGSRHMAFTPDGTLAYVTNFVDNTVSVYSFDYTLPTISGTPSDGVVGTAYSSFTPTVTGPDVTVSIESGTLPPGLTLSAGVISGTPTSNGSYPVTLEASNDNGDATLAVTFSITLPSYPVSFDSAGGSPEPDAQSVVLGDLVAQPADPTLSGYVFDGWWDDATQWDFATDTVSGPLTLTADWVPLYAVTFDAAGGSPVPASQSVTTGDLATAPSDPTLAGYVFDGWWDDATQWDFATDTISGPLTLTAHWLALPVITGAPTADAPIDASFTWTPTITAAAGFIVTSTALPAGLALDESTGVISGTPSGALGDTPITLTVTDSVGSATFDVTVTTTHGSAQLLTVTASTTTPDQGGTITLTVVASDADANMWDVTNSAVITSDFASDVIVGNQVTFPHASPHLLTATFDGATGTVLINVIPAASPAIVLGTTGGTLALWLLPWSLGAFMAGVGLLVARLRRANRRRDGQPGSA
ncbi:MAG TPA: InlB B-repeat-containing protein [Galbitalea sp.]|jgi:uncharacterized repeat protein (TIGR02543 family)|nr:InlB B-repeat-containing protein [Galbitalea sp.]